MQNPKDIDENRGRPTTELLSGSKLVSPISALRDASAQAEPTQTPSRSTQTLAESPSRRGHHGCGEPDNELKPIPTDLCR